MGLPSLLYNGYRVSLLEVKWPGHSINHPPPYITEVKERVELYFYSPSGPSWPVWKKQKKSRIVENFTTLDQRSQIEWDEILKVEHYFSKGPQNKLKNGTIKVYS
jgi:hypothetical protein